MKESPREILDTMLGYLGFITEIKEFPHENGLTLQIYSHESDRLTGRNGETLDDIQLLLNRLLQAQDPHAPRVQVDVEHYREMRDDLLVQRAHRSAEVVRQTGRPCHLPPMNAYDRRLIHNAFKDDPDVMTWSPPDDARMKRITLKRRVASPKPSSKSEG
jgi:spoIIIJ-associated protein